WYREEAFARSHGCSYRSPTDFSCDIPKLRDAWFTSHPELRDWRGQAKRYLTEMRDCTKGKTLDACIDDWNSHAGYLDAVKALVSQTKTLLAAPAAVSTRPHWLVIHDTDVPNDEQLQLVNESHRRRGYPKSTLGYYIAYH